MIGDIKKTLKLIKLVERLKWEIKNNNKVELKESYLKAKAELEKLSTKSK